MKRDHRTDRKGSHMNTWKKIKQWIAHACVYYTAFTLMLILVKLLMDGVSGAGAINTVSFLLLFPCALAFAAAGELLGSAKLPRWSRILLHYLIAMLSVFFFLWLPSNVSASPVSILLMLALLSLLYWVVFGLIALIRSRVKRLLEED